MSENNANNATNGASEASAAPTEPNQESAKQGMAVLQWLAVAAAIGIILTVVLNYFR